MMHSQVLKTCKILLLILPLIMVWFLTCSAETPDWLYDHQSISEESARVAHRESKQDTAARLKRDVSDELFPKEINFTLKTGQHTRDIALKKNALISTGHKVYTIKDGKVVVDETVNNKTHKIEYYQSPEHGAAMVVTCLATPEHKCRHYQMAGVLDLDGAQYVILPRKSNGTTLLQHQSIKHEDYLLKRLNSNIEFTDDSLSPPGKLIRKHVVDPPQSRKKRATGDYTVELLMVLDYSVFQYWYNKTDPGLIESEREVEAKELAEQYYAFVNNGIDMRYKSIDAPDISISVSYGGLVIVTTPAESPWTEDYVDNEDPSIRKSLNIEPVIEAFTNWSTGASDLPGFDHAMLFTAHDMIFNGKASVTGVAYVRGICANYRTSVVENYFDFKGITTAAHELAHSLGARHDGRLEEEGNSCLEDSGFIMASYANYRPIERLGNKWYFSSCSVDYFRAFIGTLDTNGVNCLKVANSDLDSSNIADYLVKKPGQLYDVDLQCSYAMGGDSYLCRSLYNEYNASIACSKAYCAQPANTAICEAITFGEGTPCGDKKWCIDGECVADVNANPGTAFTDACPFGDQSGVVREGATCSEMVAVYAYACRFPYRVAQCCVSCRGIYTGVAGCEYGDGSISCNVITANNRRLCYDYKKICCGTCFQLENPDNVGCEYGDKVSDCVASMCSRYTEETRTEFCCETCWRNTTPVTVTSLPPTMQP